MCSAFRQGSHIRQRECVCRWVDIIYLSFSKKHRLIIALIKIRLLWCVLTNQNREEESAGDPHKSERQTALKNIANIPN